MTHPAEARAMAHRHGPPSEQVNAEHMVKSGKAQSHRELILADLRAHPGSTAGEIADRIADDAVDDVEVRRRLTDAKRRGEAWCGYTRICAVAHTNQMEWWTAPDAKQASLPI